MGGNYGDQNVPAALEEIRRVSSELHLQIDLFLLERLTIHRYGRAAAVNFEEPELVLSKIMEYCSEKGFTHFYVLLFRVRKSHGGSLRLFDGLISMAERARELRQAGRESREGAAVSAGRDSSD